MPPTLENNFLRFTLNPTTVTWNLSSGQENGPSLENIHMNVTYRRGSSEYSIQSRWPGGEVAISPGVSPAHGPIQRATLSLEPDSNGLRCTFTFSLLKEHPLLLWNLKLENLGSQPVYPRRLELFSLGSSNWNPQSTFSNFQPPLAFFANGWQSWSYAGVHGPGERFRRTRLGPLRAPTDVNAGTPQPNQPGHFASDMFGVLGSRSQRIAVLAGFLSQRQHFGSLEARTDPEHPTLSLWANGDEARLDPGERIATDWACLHILNVDDPDPLASYLEAVAREHDLISPDGAVPAMKAIPTGWCSWYQFSTEQFLGDLTAENIQDNLEAIRRLQSELPLDICQIDDGYEAQVGDWFSFAPAFPQGVAPLSAEIRAANLTPGIWLAPCVVHPNSRLTAEHPDWLLRGRFERPVNAGLLWNRFATALDLTHPEALAYACDVIHTAAHQWGFGYLKLDFLYTAALPGSYRDPTRTRAQVLRSALESFRAAAGEQAFLLGCGCPLGSAIGLMDAMRISADTGRSWYFAFAGIEPFFKNEPNVPSAYNAVHNALTRAPIHRRWWINDPDCLLLRADTRLTLEEIRSTATAIALTGGSLMLSDDLTALSPERLRIAEILLPLIGKAPRILDWFDADTPRCLRLDLENQTGQWHLLARFNWDDQPQEVLLNPRDFGLQGDFHIREFWSGEHFRLSEDPPALRAIPAHGVILLAARSFDTALPRYLGSDLHISQGMEVTAWEASPEGLRILIERPGHTRGEISLALPQPPKQATLNGIPIHWRSDPTGIYHLALEFVKMGELRLNR